MGGYKEYKVDQTDSLYSGSTAISYDYDDILENEEQDYFDNLHLISETSKQLKVEELAKNYDVKQRRLTWKIDLHVVPPFALIYFIAYLNRSSLGILQIEGIYPSLKMSQLQFFVSYFFFFGSYMVCQFFSNMLLRYIKPHGWISLGVLLYGAVTFGTGFVTNYYSFLGCQFLHGLFQSGTETALFYILAHYYNKRESQRRFTAIFSSSCVSGVFATIIAYAVDKYLANLHGYESWRWLLIIEGAITMGTSIILFFTIPDFPQGANFLTDRESVFLIEKLRIYHGESGYNLKTSTKDVFVALLDPIIWIPAIISIGVAYVTFAYALFEPVFMLQIIGGGSTTSNQYSIFPWVAAFIWSNMCSYVSDKLCKQHRCGFFILNCLITVAGGAMMYSIPTTALPDKCKYAGCFLVAMGSYAATPILICWSSTNLGGHLRKSVGISVQISSASLGGLIALCLFLDSDFRYRRGFIGGFALIVCSLIACAAYVLRIGTYNKEKRTTEYKQAFYSQSEKDQVLKGDRNPALDYLY